MFLRTLSSPVRARQVVTDPLPALFLDHAEGAWEGGTSRGVATPQLSLEGPSSHPTHPEPWDKG